MSWRFNVKEAMYLQIGKIPASHWQFRKIASYARWECTAAVDRMYHLRLRDYLKPGHMMSHVIIPGISRLKAVAATNMCPTGVKWGEEKPQLALAFQNCAPRQSNMIMIHLGIRFIIFQNCPTIIIINHLNHHKSSPQLPGEGSHSTTRHLGNHDFVAPQEVSERNPRCEAALTDAHRLQMDGEI